MRRVILVLLFVMLMWIVQIYQHLSGYDLAILGIFPRDTDSLTGILFTPLIHGSWGHLISNTLPILILGFLLFIIYDHIAMSVWILNYVITGLLVWIFARGLFHVGASGLIYGLASFLLFSGFFRMDVRSIAIASFVAIFYGGMVWGIFPLQPGVSWESHLCGGITGLILAFTFRNSTDNTAREEEVDIEEERKSYDAYLNSRN